MVDWERFDEACVEFSYQYPGWAAILIFFAAMSVCASLVISIVATAAFGWIGAVPLLTVIGLLLRKAIQRLVQSYRELDE